MRWSSMFVRRRSTRPGASQRQACLWLRQLPAYQIAGLEKYKDRPIVVSCRTGSRSRSAVAYLAENGFAEVYNLAGGLIA